MTRNGGFGGEENKEAIKAQISEMVGFDIRIGGDISYTILPRPNIVIYDIDIADKESGESIIKAGRLFAAVDITDILQGRVRVNSVVLTDGNLNLGAVLGESEGGSGGTQNLRRFVRENLFSAMALRNFTSTYKDKSFDRINMYIQSLGSTGLTVAGSLRFMEGTVNDMVAFVTWDDQDNLSSGLRFSYSQRRDNFSANIVYSDKDEIKTLSGTLRLSTINLTRFVNSVNPDLVLPKQQVFSSRLEMSADIRTSENAIVFSDGTFESEETSGTWSMTLPFDVDTNNDIVFEPENTRLNADFATLRLGKFVTVPRTDLAREPETLFETGDNPKIFRLFEIASISLKAKNFIMPRRSLTNFALNTSPIRGGQLERVKAEAGVRVDRITYTDNRSSMDATGTIARRKDGMAFAANIRTMPSFPFANPIFKNVTVSNLRGHLLMDGDRFSLKDYSFNIGGSAFSGNTIERDGAKTSFDITSPAVDIARFATDPVDLNLILSKLALIKGHNVTMDAKIGDLKMGDSRLGNFTLAASYIDDDLRVTRVEFNDGESTNRISGNLNNINDDTGEFENFTYVVTSNSRQRVTIPIVQNNFIDRIIKSGVNTVNIQMDGRAENPNINIAAESGNIKVRVQGHLQDKASNYKIDFTHDELKGFMFAGGYISAEMLDFIYDGIPFHVTAQIQDGRAQNLRIDIDGNVFTGEADERGATLDINGFDIRTIFKKLPSNEAWVNMLLRIIGTSRHDIHIMAREAMNYDNVMYRDFEFDLVAGKTPGRLRFGLEHGGARMNIESEVVGGQAFDGTFSLKDYNIGEPLSTNGLMDIKSGKLKLDMKFTASGGNMNQILAGLSGNFSAHIENGGIKGISSQPDQLRNITDLANITTNNIMYVFENSFAGGELSFQNLAVEGQMQSAAISNAKVRIEADNLTAVGTLAFNIISKAVELAAVFELRGLSPDNVDINYTANGFINNLQTKIDATNSIGRINIPFLQRRKREMASPAS